MKKRVGLVLTGGGARGAYQAGVLFGISEIMPMETFSFPIITGISAGCINAAFLACFKGTFHESARRLWEIWGNLTSEQVFHQTRTRFASMAIRALLNIYFGNIVKTAWPDALLDSSPLDHLVRKHIDVDAINERIKAHELNGVCFSAMNFNSGSLTSFFEADARISPWKDEDRIGVFTKLNHKHVMASAAIPGIFKLVEIDQEYFGDGSTRVAFPVAPAIKMGADKIFAIDMRCADVDVQTKVPSGQYPKMAEIFATLLGALYSDSLDRDLERLNIVNRLVKESRETHRQWREVPSFLIRPSCHLGETAKGTYHALSPALRRLLGMLGQSSLKGSDLMSHLAFESVYTEKLLHLGRQDALKRRDEIKKFLTD